jgi:hypothetical protein
MKTRILGAAMCFLSVPASYAQSPYPQASSAPPAQQYQQFPQQAEQPHPMRAMFAQSLAQVVQTGGNAAMIAVADGLTGALKSWFDSKRQRKGQNGALAGSYAPAAAPQMSSYPQPANYPQPGSYPQSSDPNAGSYPTSQYPAPGEYPQQDGGVAGNTPYPDPNYPNTGYPQPAGYPSPGAAPAAPAQIYAGIAYEVHLLQPGGNTAPVDIATYAFRTGDQFRVYYRPSLPGRIDVFNINAVGQTSQIDSSVVAAGELTALGPYQFTDMQGEETLVLKLSPCVTPQLYAATRSIVKVQDAQPVGNTLGLGDCSSTSTRGLKTRTRDIRKVAVEGGTSFALDPIAPTELGGAMDARQVTITLHHR